MAPWTYADYADLFAGAPVVARVRVDSAVAIKGAGPASTARFYVEADVVSLIRAPAAQPPRLRFLADVPLDSRGRAARPARKSEWLIAAAPTGRPGELRLLARDALLPADPAAEARIRTVVAAANAADAAPRVTGVASAFYVPGSIPGESETQIFLATAGRPASLTVLRRPGQAPRAGVAFGEFIDDNAGLPPRDTLGWWRLACFLPPALPDAAVAELDASGADAARADYAVALAQLGPCPRVRKS